jgi:hypothetical protein
LFFFSSKIRKELLGLSGLDSLLQEMVFVTGCGGLVSFFEDEEDCTVETLRAQIEVRLVVFPTFLHTLRILGKRVQFAQIS